MLNGPTQHHLRGCSAEAIGYGGDRRVPERFPALERAVGHRHDPLLMAVVDERAPVVEWTELHLVDGGRARSVRDQRPQPPQAEGRLLSSLDRSDRRPPRRAAPPWSIGR